MLEENKNYTISETLTELDKGLTTLFCKDCNNCPLAFNIDITISINGHSHTVWCYGALLGYTVVETLDK